MILTVSTSWVAHVFCIKHSFDACHWVLLVATSHSHAFLETFVFQASVNFSCFCFLISPQSEVFLLGGSFYAETPSVAIT